MRRNALLLPHLRVVINWCQFLVIWLPLKLATFSFSGRDKFLHIVSYRITLAYTSSVGPSPPTFIVAPNCPLLSKCCRVQTPYLAVNRILNELEYAAKFWFQSLCQTHSGSCSSATEVREHWLRTSSSKIMAHRSTERNASASNHNRGSYTTLRNIACPASTRSRVKWSLGR